ncbi:AAA family ATPase, partial [bacterium]|nr:AAA family ATPase [bacterium]
FDLDTILLKVAKDKINYCNNEGKVNKSQLMTGSETALGQIHDSSRLHENLLNITALLSDSTFYLNPNTAFGTELRLPQVTRYENKLLGDGQNLVNYLHTVYTENKDLREKIVTGMQAAFGNVFEEIIFAPAAEQYIQMKIKWKHLTWQQPSSVLSDGILKYLFILALFADAESHSLIAIDEPEIGLHPGLFPIIAEYADEASGHTQVVISTHSPEFLNALQEVNPKTTVTVFDWVDGETELKTLSGEKLDYWLNEYKLGEMFRSGGLEAI